MEKTERLRKMQHYISNIGIAGSSLRNQGACGVVNAARKFLAEIDLSCLSNLDPFGFPSWLDDTTEKLLREFPEKAQKWGAARKAINIFTTQAFLNGELSAAFSLSRLGDLMETPLDSVAAKKLRTLPGGDKLPLWQGVGRLTPEINRRYQEFALEVAQAEGIPRGCLDLILWQRSS